jgi:hypothetical protein
VNDHRTARKITAVFILVSLLLQGCSGSESILSVTDELAICVDEHYYPMLKSMIRDYTETYPNVKITFEIVLRDDSTFRPFIDEDYRYTALRKLQSEIMSGSGPDLFILDAGYNVDCFFPDINKAMRSGVFCDLLPLLREAGIREEDFIRPVFDAGKIDGKLYIAPLEYQVNTLLTTEASRQNLDSNRIRDTTVMLAGIRGALEVPGTGAQPTPNRTPVFDYVLNPYYFAAQPLVDYDAESVQIDTPLTRNILETGKFATDQIKQYKAAAGQDWIKYMRSNRNFVFSPYFLASVDHSVWMTMTGCGVSMNIEPLPSEDGGVCAVVSSFAGIRANSRNKSNAVNMIELLLNQRYQTRKNGNGFAYPREGYPVRKGVLAQRLYDLVETNNAFGSTYFCVTEVYIADSIVQEFVSLESRITAARLPTPNEINDVMFQYYAGELELETALLRMQEYWEISLSE